MIAADPADDLRRVLFGPIETSGHKSHLVGLGASRREDHVIELHSEQPGETSRNRRCKRMSELVKAAEALQPFGLLADCSHKPWMTMTEGHTVDLRAAIEVPIAFCVIQPHTLGAFDGDGHTHSHWSIEANQMVRAH